MFFCGEEEEVFLGRRGDTVVEKERGVLKGVFSAEARGRSLDWVDCRAVSEWE